MRHPDDEVQAAITRLLDALCSWGLATGRDSVLILREVGGFQVRAQSGKPIIPEYWTDGEVLELVPEAYP